MKQVRDPSHSELIALLRAERAPDTATRERVAARLARSVGALVLSQTEPASSAPGAGAAARLAHAVRTRFLGVCAGFALGGAAGAIAYSRLHPTPAARVVYVERAVHAPAASVLEPSTSVVAPEASAVASAQTARNAPLPASASVAREPTLNEQQALLDEARTAFARGDYAATLKALSAHARRFPKSMLIEEREALEIKALAASGRASEASARAARFKAEFPQSLLLPSVNDSLLENQ